MAKQETLEAFIKEDNKQLYTRPIGDIIEDLKNWHKRHRKDFQTMYRPSENFFTGTSTWEGERPSIADLKALATQRLGVISKITRGMAEDALRNDFEFIDIRTKESILKSRIRKWIIDSDLMNAFVDVVEHERTYGTGFLMKYFGDETKENDKYEKEPPNKPPIKYQAFGPDVLHPKNEWSTKLLDIDREELEFQGGRYQVVKIHKDRIHVLCTRKLIGTWRGLAIVELMYLSVMMYYHAFIWSGKHLRKWGSIVPTLKMGSQNPNKESFDEYMELMQEFEMNYFYLIGKDDELDFINTQISSGFSEILEMYKEDISSGSGVPLNILFGRAVSGGIGGEGAVESKKDYATTLGNLQRTVKDDLIKIIKDAGFNMDYLDIKFGLASQKTKEQELIEMRMEVEVDLLKEELKQAKLITKNMREGNFMQKTEREEEEKEE